MNTYYISRIKNFILFILIFGLVTLDVTSQDLSEAKKLCSNLNATNRALAAQAGYDVDELCGEVSSLAMPLGRKALPPQPLVERSTVSQASTQRNSSEVVTPVPVSGIESKTKAFELKPFGYDLFANSPTTFAPAASIPVSSEYILGPGDTLDILFYGKLNSSFSVEINREGFVDFPEIGPVGLSGMTYREAKEILQTRIAQQVVGTKVSISMGSLRTIQVFVLGEAFKPGAYTISSLSTITHALVSGGGVSNIGSLRNIQLKRDGKVIASIDLYDFLLNGDTSGDQRVREGDVIYVPTVGELVSIEGQILRPAIYEMKGGESVDDLIQLAGGTGPKVKLSNTSLFRISGNGFMTTIDLNLTLQSDRNFTLQNGDHIKIGTIIGENQQTVSLKGHVYYPGDFSLLENMRLSDLLNEITEHRPGLDLEYAMLTRTDPETGYKSAIQVDLRKVYDKNIESDIYLQDRDELRLFSLDGSRSSALSGLITALENQTRAGQLPPLVSVRGARLSGKYPLVSGMRISDLVSAAGGVMSNYADLDYTLLVRENLSEGGNVTVIPVVLKDILLKDNKNKDLILMPKDQLFIFSQKENRSSALREIIDRLNSQARLNNLAKVISVSGPVRFPGTYPLTPNMTVSDLIEAAGGLNVSAYAVTGEIARLDLTDPTRAEILISLANLSYESAQLLKPGDSLTVKRIPDFQKVNRVSLEGQFVFPGDYIFSEGDMLMSVIDRAGGFTKNAYIDGAIFLRESLRTRELNEKNRIVKELGRELDNQALIDSNSMGSLSIVDLSAKRLAISRLSDIEPTGRLVIPLKKILNSEADDLVLKSGDRLLIPTFSQEVTVMGEVKQQASHMFDPSLTLNEYIMKSGGFNDNAKKSGIIVVKASGEVVNPRRNLLFFGSRKSRISPGDTIIVPLDTDQNELKGWPLLAEVSTIIYQLALGAAAVNSFNSN